MDKLMMCRICCVENVRMYYVDTKLQEIYEKLTSLAFETKDRRPLQVCYLCCARLRNSYLLLICCLQSEQYFNQLSEYSDIGSKPFQYMSMLHVVYPPIVHFSIESGVSTEPGDIHVDVKMEPLEVVEDAQLKQGYINGDPACQKVNLTELEENSKILEIEVNLKSTKYIDNKIQTKKANFKKKLKDSLDREGLHHGDKKYSCTKCEKCFSEKVQLSKHIRLHRVEEPHRCNICKKTYSDKSNLNRHTRIHTGEKPYECDFCKKCYSDKSHLNRHIRIHTGEKPFKCHICKKSYRQKSYLSTHIRTHTGEKPYKCEICDKRFYLKDDLLKHIRIHTGEKPYKCNICKKSYSQKSHLNRHNRIHT